MSEFIYREIWLTENRRIEPIPATENSKIPIHLKVMDVTLSGTSAQAYSFNSKDSTYKKNAQNATIASNVVTLIPSSGFFLAGHDQLQINFPVSGGSYITKEINVSCSPDFSAGGSTPAAEDVVPLVERAEEAAALAQQVKDSIPADYSQLSASTTEIARIVGGINLFDKTTIVSGKCFNTSGTPVNVNVGYASDFIPVTPGTDYYIGNSLGSQTYAHCFYDSSKAFIGYTLSNQKPGDKIQIPDGAAYIRLSGALASIESQYLKTRSVSEKASDLIIVSEQQPTEDGNKLWINPNTSRIGVPTAEAHKRTEESVARVIGGLNLFVAGTVTNGKCLNATGGTVNVNVGYYSDYIPVEAGKEYYIGNSLGSSSYYHCFYDADKSFVSATPSNNAANSTIRIPDGVAFVRLSGAQASIGAQYLQHISIPDKYVENMLSVESLIANFNLYNGATSTRGVAQLASGTTQGNSNFFRSDFITVTPGERYEIVPSLGSLAYGQWWYDKDKTFIKSDYANKTAYTAPEGAAYLRVTGLVANINTTTVKNCKISELETTVEQGFQSVNSGLLAVNNRIDNLPTVTGDSGLHDVINGHRVRTALTDGDNGIDGFTYCAFSSGVVFNGKEVHATRIGKNHVTPEDVSERGKIVFHVYDAAGNLTVAYPNIDYAALDGELRDPALTVSKGYLLLSCFSKRPYGHGSYLFALDKDFNVTSQCSFDAAENYAVWGNALVTPDGYILKTAYRTNGPYLALLRSSIPFNGSLDGMTFTNALALDNMYNGNPTEATLGYHKDKLVAIWRVNDHNARMRVTSDLEGLTGWSDYYLFDQEIHSPVLFQHCNDDLLIFGGSIIVAGYRKPGVGVIDTSTGECKAIAPFDDTIVGGGYPSFVRLDDTKISSVYYTHRGETLTTLYHRVIDIMRIPAIRAVIDPTTVED